MLSGWFCLQARVYSAALPFHPMDSTSGFHPLDSTLWTPPYGFPPLTLPAAGHGGRWRLHSGARRVPEEGCRHAGQPHIHRALHHQVSGDSWKGVAFHCWRESPEGCSGAETCSPVLVCQPCPSAGCDLTASRGEGSSHPPLCSFTYPLPFLPKFSTLLNISHISPCCRVEYAYPSGLRQLFTIYTVPAAPGSSHVSFKLATNRMPRLVQALLKYVYVYMAE